MANNDHERGTREPSLGDLDSLLQQEDKTMGKIDQLSDDELIGDLSVLDETIAELDSEIQQSAPLDEEFATLEDEDEIPLLGESAIVMEGGANFPTMEEESFSISQIEQLTEDKSALADEEDAPVLTEIDQEDLEKELPMETVGEEAIAPDDSVFANSLFEGSADEAASANSADDGAVFSDMDPMDSLIDESPSIPAEAAVDSKPAAAPEPAPAAPVAASTTASMAASAGTGALGGELHAILSSKLDAIVSETLSAIGNELHNRLAGQIEDMIMQSVDRSLPPLMEKFSEGLRSEIESQVRDQLPGIVNNLMGSMKISE